MLPGNLLDHLDRNVAVRRIDEIALVHIGDFQSAIIAGSGHHGRTAPLPGAVSSVSEEEHAMEDVASASARHVATSDADERTGRVRSAHFPSPNPLVIAVAPFSGAGGFYARSWRKPRNTDERPW